MSSSDFDPQTLRTPAVIVGIVAAVVLVLAVALFIVAVEPVDEGYRGVVKDKGAVTGEVWGPGWHIRTPFVETVEHIEVRERTYTMSGNVHEGDVDQEDAIDFMSADQQRVGVDVTVRYQIEAGEVDQFHSEWNHPGQYEERVLRPETMDTVQMVASAMNATEANSDEGRAELSASIAEALNEESPSSVNIVSVQVRDIHFDEAYVEQLEKVERAVEEANAERERAEGQADAERIRAEGEAEALNTVQEQLAEDPDAILAYEQIQAYDGGTVYVIDPETNALIEVGEGGGNETAQAWGESGE